MPRPTIRHIAIYTQDAQKLAEFYKKVFDMDILMTGVAKKGSYVMLSDGYLTLALLPHSLDHDSRVGIDHFGFVIESQEEIEKRLVAMGVRAPGGRPSDRPYAEKRARDPEGNQFDLSVHGYDRSEATTVPQAETVS